MGLFVDLNPEEMMMGMDGNLDDPDLEAELAAITGKKAAAGGKARQKGKSKCSSYNLKFWKPHLHTHPSTHVVGTANICCHLSAALTVSGYIHTNAVTIQVCVLAVSNITSEFTNLPLDMICKIMQLHCMCQCKQEAEVLLVGRAA